MGGPGDRRERASAQLRRAGAIGVGLVLLALVPTSGTHAAFVGSTGNTSTFAANPDWLAPAVSATVIQKTEGYTPGFVRAGGTYRVYANAADAAGSNPTSGVGTVTANVTQLTTGATASALSAPGATVGGTAYGFGSTTPPTVSAGTTAGAKTYTVTANDAATPSNPSTALTGNVTVDNTPPAASGLTLVHVNGPVGSAARRPNQNDVVTFTWNDVIEPQTVLDVPAGWTGTNTTVTVAFANNTGAGGFDVMSINSSKIGAVNLGDNRYVTAATSFTGSVTTWTTTATTSVLRITLGTMVAGGATAQAGGRPSVIWSPVTGIIDRAGNPISLTTFTEPDRDNDF